MPRFLLVEELGLSVDATRILFSAWKFLSTKPGGKYVFSKLLGLMVPYSGSVSPQIEELEPGFCRIRIQERRALRNHLNSIHALALANVGELCSGLATVTQLSPDMRAIVTSLQIDYKKKARGQIVVEARVKLPPIEKETEFDVESKLSNAQNDLVATMRVKWLVRRKT